MVAVVIAVSSVFNTDGVKDLRLEMFNKIKVLNYFLL